MGGAIASPPSLTENKHHLGPGQRRGRKRGNRKMSPAAEREGRAEGRAWHGRVRDRGQGTPPAAQGARRAPGLFPERRGGAGVPGGHPVWGRGRTEGAPAGGLESAARAPAAAASPAGATATQPAPGAPAAIIGAMDRGRGKRSRKGRPCCTGRGRENRANRRRGGVGGTVGRRGGEWKARCCVCRCLLLPQAARRLSVLELRGLLCVKPAFHTLSLNFIKESPQDPRVRQAFSLRRVH